MMRKYETKELQAMEEAKDFLNGYRLCRELLGLQRYERKRNVRIEACSDETLLAGDEAFWRARIHTIYSLLEKMKNGREKLMLYYHFIKGDSVERIAVRLGVSRRTGFRICTRGLLEFYRFLEALKKQSDAKSLQQSDAKSLYAVDKFRGM